MSIKSVLCIEGKFSVFFSCVRDIYIPVVYLGEQLFKVCECAARCICHCDAQVMKFEPAPIIQSATQPFLVSSRNAPPHCIALTTLKTAVQQTSSLMDWVPISESSNMATRGWLLFLVLTVSFYVCHGKKKVTKEVKNKQTYIKYLVRSLNLFLKCQYVLATNSKATRICPRLKLHSIKLKMTSLPAN